MTGTKAWYLSNGMRGALIAIMGSVAGFFNVEVDVERAADTIMQLIPPVVAIYGGIAAWTGRRDATTQIEKREK